MIPERPMHEGPTPNKSQQLGVTLDPDHYQRYKAQAERFAAILLATQSLTILRPGAAYLRWLIDRGDQFLDELEAGK